MNPEAQVEFDRLLKINPQDLTPDEVVFLNARRTYLTDDQLRIYGEVLKKYQDSLKEAPLYVAKKDRK